MVDPAAWHPVDRRVARWYSWLVVVGYSASIGMLVLAVGPILYRMLSGALGRFVGIGGATRGQLLDSSVFLAITVVQLSISGSLWLRERQRQTSRLHHVVA
jgi:hypothetical protein